MPLKKKPVAFRLAMLVTLMSSYCMHVKEWKCKPDDVARLNKRSNTGLNISLLSIISKLQNVPTVVTTLFPKPIPN